MTEVSQDAALQGIADFERVNIGYIPTGSSNDFARALNWHGEPVELLKKILACKEPVRFDLGRLKYEELSDVKVKDLKALLIHI